MRASRRACPEPAEGTFQSASFCGFWSILRGLLRNAKAPKEEELLGSDQSERRAVARQPCTKAAKALS